MACAGEEPVDHPPMVPSSHVIPTAQVAEGFFRNPEHTPLSSPLWVLVCIISQDQRVETLSCTMYRTRPLLVVALLEGVPLYPDRSCVTKMDNE